MFSCSTGISLKIKGEVGRLKGVTHTVTEPSQRYTHRRCVSRLQLPVTPFPCDPLFFSTVTSRPRSTNRLEIAESIIQACKSQPSLTFRARRALTEHELAIHSTLSSIQQLGAGRFRKFSAGRKQYMLEEVPISRLQMTKMLAMNRRQLKRAHNGVV